ncbi:hypothetical protein FXO37_25080 [Capsicum annuum]|nr:hypothetical protein FXO37_25080 [Capsicum annuum]
MEVKQGAPHSLTANVPFSSINVDHSLSITNIKPKIVELCKDLFNQWSNLDNSHFSVETVSGGITNLLLKVSVREDDVKHVNMTVRLYGPNTEYVINRERELLAIQHLSAAGFGAKLLGVFGNGMVQSFIDARTLTPAAAPPNASKYMVFQAFIKGSFGTPVWISRDIPWDYFIPPSIWDCDVPNVSLPALCYCKVGVPCKVKKNMKTPKLAAEIAKQLRKFHQVEIPGSKEPQVWNDVLKFFKNASTLQFDDGEKKIKYETISFQEVHKEIIELKELTDCLNAPVVFAHNDLLSGNLMLNEDKVRASSVELWCKGQGVQDHLKMKAGVVDEKAKSSAEDAKAKEQWEKVDAQLCSLL